MTGRTHDLAAFTALNLVVATQPLTQVSFATVLVAFSANMLGGLAPDIDQSTSSFWHKFRAGTFLGHFIAPLIGGHRFLSHSIIGVILFGILLSYFLAAINTILLVDMRYVWWAFMIGYVSHLITDSFTRDGVPWLFPIPIRLGFPPIRALRFKTGGFIEKFLIFPLLMLANGLLFYYFTPKYLELLHNYIK